MVYTLKAITLMRIQIQNHHALDIGSLTQYLDGDRYVGIDAKTLAAVTAGVMISATKINAHFRLHRDLGG